MNRRKFFKSLAIGAVAIVVAPKLLESKSKLDGYTIPKPRIHGIKMRNNFSMVRTSADYNGEYTMHWNRVLTQDEINTLYNKGFGIINKL